MKQTLARAGCIAICMAGSAAPAGASDLTITTGGPDGTYFAFGRDIAVIADGAGLDIEVVDSRGSVDNLARILGFEGAGNGKFYQLGFVQADVLQEVRELVADNDVLRPIVDKIRVVMPLYGEEVHVIAPGDTGFTDLKDLLMHGDAVAGGKTRSGELHTARALARLLGEAGGVEIEPVGQEEALKAVAQGVVDAMIHVAGAPSKLAATISPDQDLKLLSIDEPELTESPDSPYREASLSRTQYPWISGKVTTIAVKALLVSYDYDEDNENCGRIRDLVRAMRSGIGELVASGHPKWREVDPDEARDRSDLSVCAKLAYDQ